jgi:hypothetical protein
MDAAAATAPQREPASLGAAADRLVTIALADWSQAESRPEWIAAVEAGRVLYFPRLPFALSPHEQGLLGPQLLEKGVRNISLDPQGRLKGAAGDADTQAAVAALIARFSSQARSLLRALVPAYEAHLRPGPASLRPVQVATRSQSVRADDRRLHVDAFPSRPNRGERILRVFSNVSPEGEPRVWRIGPPFEEVARRFVPQAKPYVAWQARVLERVGITKSLRSEYDHLMLQLHDRMKADADYQRECPQLTFPFPAGSTWVCFSDQTVHAVMSGQHLLEQTVYLPATRQYDPQASPLGILSRVAGHPLV